MPKITSKTIGYLRVSTELKISYRAGLPLRAPARRCLSAISYHNMVVNSQRLAEVAQPFVVFHPFCIDNRLVHGEAHPQLLLTFNGS